MSTNFHTSQSCTLHSPCTRLHCTSQLIASHPQTLHSISRAPITQTSRMMNIDNTML